MINLIELKRWRDYIATIPAEKIEMESWRSGTTSTPECDSVGCIVGHCTALYTMKQLPKDMFNQISFINVAERFLGIESEDPLWDFLFSSEWGYYANVMITQKDFALLRMDYVLKHGEQPDNWQCDMTYSTLKNIM